MLCPIPVTPGLSPPPGMFLLLFFWMFLLLSLHLPLPGEAGARNSPHSLPLFGSGPGFFGNNAVNSGQDAQVPHAAPPRGGFGGLWVFLGRCRSAGGSGRARIPGGMSGSGHASPGVRQRRGRLPRNAPKSGILGRFPRSEQPEGGWPCLILGFLPPESLLLPGWAEIPGPGGWRGAGTVWKGPKNGKK